jgi:UDPglucose 6-dehydrogenase
MIRPTLAVLGLGKLGLPLAALFAAAGHRVHGLDANPAHVAALEAGGVPSPEPGLIELLAEARPRLSFAPPSAHPSDAAASIVLVPTPSVDSGAFASTAVERACEGIGKSLAARGPGALHLVVIASTVMPGTVVSRIIPLLEATSGRRVGDGLRVAYVPEFVALGQVLAGYRTPAFVLVGADEAASGTQAAELFRSITPLAPVARMSIAEAEVCKLFYNVLFASKIAIGNLIGEVSSGLGCDPDAIAAALELEPRIGRGLLRAGPPFGGPCLPRDVRALAHLSAALGLRDGIGQAMQAANSAHADWLAAAVPGIPPDRVALLGGAFKTDTAVTDDAPARLLIPRLRARGLAVSVHDDSAAVRAAFARDFPDVPCRAVSLDDLEAASAVVLCGTDRRMATLATQLPAATTVVDLWGILPLRAGLVRPGRPAP